MSSTGKKYACQESKFLTTLGTTIYVASRAEKTKDCSDTFCGERGSFANPSLCLGEAFDLAESKSAGKDIKFAIEILTKEIVGSEETSVLSVPAAAESITGFASGTNVSGLDELILNHPVSIQNLRGLKTILTVAPELSKIKSEGFPENDDFAVDVGSSQFAALKADVPSGTDAKLNFNDVELLSPTEGSKIPTTPTTVSAGNGSNLVIRWTNGVLSQGISTDTPSITVGKGANVTFITDGVDATLPEFPVDNTQGGNLILSRKNGNWNYTGDGENFLTGCVECKQADECKKPDLSNKNCPCKKPCRLGSTTLSDENMVYSAPGTIRKLDAFGGELVKVKRNNVKYFQNVLQKTKEEITAAIISNIDSVPYTEDSDKVEINGEEVINALGETKGMIARNKYTADSLSVLADGEGTGVSLEHTGGELVDTLNLSASNNAELNHFSKDVNVGSREIPASLTYTATMGGQITTNQQGGTQQLSEITANIDPLSSLRQNRQNLRVIYNGGDAAAETYKQDLIPEEAAKEAAPEGAAAEGISLTDENVNIQTTGAFRDVSGKNLEQKLTDTNIEAAPLSPEMTQWTMNVNLGGNYNEILRNVTFTVPGNLNKKATSEASWYGTQVADGAKANSIRQGVEVMAPNQNRTVSLGKGATMTANEQGVNYRDAGQKAQLLQTASLELQQKEVTEIGSNTWSVGEGATLSINKRGHKATTNGERTLDSYDLAPRAAANVSDNGGNYTAAPSGAETFDSPVLTYVAAKNAHFTYASNGTKIRAAVDLGNNLKNARPMRAAPLARIQANGNSTVEWSEQGVSKNLQGISDLKAIYTDHTKALHTKKLSDERIENVDGAANDFLVSGNASLNKLHFGNQATMQSDDFNPTSIYVKTLTADNGRVELEAATNSIKMPQDAIAFEFSGPNTSAALQGGELNGGISVQASTNEDVSSVLKLNNLEHIGDTMLSGPATANFSSGNTTGHVHASDGAKLEVRNHVHQGTDSSIPLILSMNASKIQKSVYTAVLQKDQSAIRALGDKHLSLVKDLVKLKVDDDYDGIVYDYRDHKGKVDIDWGNLNAGRAKRVLEGHANNKPTLRLAESGTFLTDATIKNVMLEGLATAPKF
jgi:hypothetical protein